MDLLRFSNLKVFLKYFIKLHHPFNKINIIDAERIESKLKEIKGKTKRERLIDSYSWIVQKFQKWMFQLHFFRNTMKEKPKGERSDDENTIIDFALFYNDNIAPKMKFYKIKNLYWNQGFDLASYLMTDFKYLGFNFTDLPIWFQSIFTQTEICLVWYDDTLKSKLEKFYIKYFDLLNSSFILHDLEILPVSLLENEKFGRIIENRSKFRIIYTFYQEKIKDSKLIINNLNLEEYKGCKEFMEIIKNKTIGKYMLKGYDPELNNDLEDDIKDWNKILEDYIRIELGEGLCHSFTKSSLNILNSFYQKCSIEEFNLERVKYFSSYIVSISRDEEYEENIREILNNRHNEIKFPKNEDDGLGFRRQYLMLNKKVH